MKKNQILNEINSSVYYCVNAHNAVYRGKVFAVKNGDIKFFKTKRGAEGYIKRQQLVVYYDEMTMEMKSCGDGAEIFEIKENELVDYKTDKKIWYNEIYAGWNRHYQQSWAFDNVNWNLNEYKPCTEIIEYVETLKAEILNNDWRMPVFMDEETAEETQVIQEETTTVTEETAENEIIISENVEIVYNDEKNGIELHFEKKPSSEIIQALKVVGFRWSKRGFWYAKQTEEIINFIKCFENGTCEPVTVQTAAEEKINISDMDDLESYKIDESICKMENDNSFFRRKDRNQNEELQDTLKQFNDKMKELILELPDENKNYYFKRAQSLKKKYTENFTAYLRHKALNPSWMVTGRSGLNVRKYENAMRKHDNLLQTLVETGNNMNDLIVKAQKVISKIEKEKRINTVNEKIATEAKEITIRREKKKINIAHGMHVGIFTDGNFETTAYNANDEIYIINMWGAWRYFNKTGKEIETDFKFNTLTQAKKYIGAYL